MTSPDSGTSTQGTCLGGHLLGSVCVSAAPAGPVTLTAVAGPINSGIVASGGCTEIVQRTTGPALCVIAGTTIDIPAAVLVRAFAVNPNATGTGTSPLVLFATDAITVEGTIDVASHVNDMLAGGIPALGAGARTAVGCAASGLDGGMGKPVQNSDRSYGGAGGAGGSFGTLGGGGGSGGNNNNIPPGNPVAGTGTNQLVGGCPGGTGGTGDGGMGSGTGGSGGGAVYLLAGTSITVTGKINASGAGGIAGGPGMASSGGGGGGGSGGMIGFEAPKVAIMTGAAVFANGGGGASGCGQVNTATGMSGTDSTGPAAPGGGGAGKDGGGGGGAGSLAAGTGTAGTKGGNNNNAGQESAGGGGGGGAGVIRVFSTQPATIQGAVSPPPS
jgi:hypothetical protein